MFEFNEEDDFDFDLPEDEQEFIDWMLNFQPLVEERGVFIISIESDVVVELVIKVTPRAIDGKRHVDILESYDIINERPLFSPREMISEGQINDAVDSLIWAIENNDEISEEERDKYLSELQ